MVAAPALAGVAAAFCMAPQALADPSAIQGTANPAVSADVSHLGPMSARLVSAIKQAEQASQQAGRQHAGSNLPSSYTVRSGDSLSSIAGRLYHNQDAWPVLYWANHNKIHWANDIEPGQVLKVPAKPARIPGAPGQLDPAPAAVTQTAAPVGAQSTAVVSSGAVAGGSFQQCVIARESGGNSQVMNGTGHYGLYQFSASTWAAYGGNPADFGSASVSEQNAVFNNAIAAGAQSNWSAYDGC
jgi:LysM repeat protein